MQTIGHVTVLVKDYDEAIEFYTKKLNFTVVQDLVMSKTKRWVLVAPQGSTACSILLSKAVTEEQKALIGCQSDGRVFLFLYTDNFALDYENLKTKGVKIIEEEELKAHGTVAVFADLYGNLWDLIEPVQAD